MGQELQLPDWAKQAPAGAFASLNPQEDSLSDGIGQSYPVIGYKGKQWSFRYRGERKNFISADGFPMPYIDVIILGQAKQKSKSYYKAFDPNSGDSGDRPICSAIDGVTPDVDVQQKQADHCAICPRNVWKTGANGKKGRECTDYKRLAVLVLPTQTAPLYGGTGVLEPAFLRVPPASLNSLAIMGDTMSAQGFHYASYITRIAFDPNEAHPKMVFRPHQGLSEAEAPVVLQLRQDMQVDRIINGGFAEGHMRAVPPQEGTTLLPPASQATGLVMNLTANSPSPSTGAASGLVPPATQSPAQVTGLTQANGSQPAASAQPATPTPSQASSPASTGLLSAHTASGLVTPAAQAQAGTQATPATASQTVDTGAPEAADEDLDAMIAAELAGKK